MADPYLKISSNSQIRKISKHYAICIIPSVSREIKFLYIYFLLFNSVSSLMQTYTFNYLQLTKLLKEIHDQIKSCLQSIAYFTLDTMHFHCEIRKLNEFRKVFSTYTLHYIYQTIMDNYT